MELTARCEDVRAVFKMLKPDMLQLHEHGAGAVELRARQTLRVVVDDRIHNRADQRQDDAEQSGVEHRQFDAQMLKHWR